MKTVEVNDEISSASILKDAEKVISRVFFKWNSSDNAYRLQLVDEYFQVILNVANLGHKIDLIEQIILRALVSFHRIKMCRNENVELRQKCCKYVHQTSVILKGYYIKNELGYRVPYLSKYLTNSLELLR